MTPSHDIVTDESTFGGEAQPQPTLSNRRSCVLQGLADVTDLELRELVDDLFRRLTLGDERHRSGHGDAGATRHGSPPHEPVIDADLVEALARKVPARAATDDCERLSERRCTPRCTPGRSRWRARRLNISSELG